MLSRRFALGLCSLPIIVGSNDVFAQDYPNKPIRIVTGTVGGGNDFTSRQVAQELSGPLGQPVVVDNKGNGVVPPDFVAKSPPDGYTLLVYGGALWNTPLFQKAPYDAIRDFSPIAQTDRTVNVVTVHPSLPVHSVKDLIALAKKDPGQLNYSSTVAGGATHLAAELFKHMADINIVGIAYKGNAPAITALISGEVQVTINDTGLVMPHVKTGKLRALAVTSATPSALAPDLPTVAASGLPGYEWIGMTGMWAPAKTPGAIINRLNQEVVRALKRPEVRERFLAGGTEIVGSSPEEFAATIKSDTIKTQKVIKDAGIHIN